MDGAVSCAEVLLVNLPGPLELALERPHEAFGEHGDAVLGALAVADDDLLQLKVDVLDAQPDAFARRSPLP